MKPARHVPLSCRKNTPICAQELHVRKIDAQSMDIFKIGAASLLFLRQPKNGRYNLKGDGVGKTCAKENIGAKSIKKAKID